MVWCCKKSYWCAVALVVVLRQHFNAGIDGDNVMLPLLPSWCQIDKCQSTEMAIVKSYLLKLLCQNASTGYRTQHCVNIQQARQTTQVFKLQTQHTKIYRLVDDQSTDILTFTMEATRSTENKQWHRTAQKTAENVKTGINPYSWPYPTHKAGSGPHPTHKAGSGPHPTHKAGSGPHPTNEAESGPYPTHKAGSGPHPTHEAGSGPYPTNEAESGPYPTHEAGSGPYPTHEAGSGPYPTHEAESGPYPTHEAGSGPYPTHEAGSGPYPTHEVGSGPYPTHEAGSGPYPTHEAGSGPYPTHKVDNKWRQLTITMCVIVFYRPEAICYFLVHLLITLCLSGTLEDQQFVNAVNGTSIMNHIVNPRPLINVVVVCNHSTRQKMTYQTGWRLRRL